MKMLFKRSGEEDPDDREHTEVGKYFVKIRAIRGLPCFVRQQRFLKECRIWKQLDHPNVLEFCGQVIFVPVEDSILIQEILQHGVYWKACVYGGVSHILASRRTVSIAETRYYYQVSPYLENGTASDWLRSNRNQGLRVLLEAAQGCHYLHTLRPDPIVHGDIKGVTL